MEYVSFVKKDIFKDAYMALLTLAPAFVVSMFIISMGSDVYRAVSAVLVNYYFAIGVGWISSPVVGLSAGLGPLSLLLILVFVAMQGSFFISFNYDLLEKVPLIGRLVKRIRKKADKVIEKHSLLENVSYVTIFWLMFIPLYGTGPMSMSLIGRILSLEWWKLWITISLSVITRYSLVISVVYFGLF